MAAVTGSDLWSEFWNDDYAPLQAAGRALTAAMRADEQESDLYRRLLGSSGSGSSGNGGSHLYVPVGVAAAAAPNGAAITPPPERLLQHRKSVPLPPLLAQQLTTVRLHSSMGLLAAADLAWMSVDEKLYLWSYNNSAPNTAQATTAASSFCSFTVLSGQCVIAVGLVRPKLGTFFSSSPDGNASDSTL